MDWFWIVLVSAFLVSVNELITKKILKKEHTTELLAITFTSTSVLLIFLSPWLNLSINPTEFMIVFVRSIIVASSILLFTKAMKHMEISSVAPLKNLTPFFLIFLSFVFLGEIITFVQVIGIFLIIFGAYFLQIHNHFLDFFKHIREFNNKYFFYALSGSALFSISAILSKIVLKTISPQAYLFYSSIIIALYFNLIIFINYNGFKDFKKGYHKTGWWAVPLSLSLILADYSYFYALSLPNALVSLVLPIRRVSALITTIIGGRLFHDHYLFHKITSAFVILIGAVLIII